MWHISTPYDKEENKPIKQPWPELYVVNAINLEYKKHLSTKHGLWSLAPKSYKAQSFAHAVPTAGI